MLILAIDLGKYNSMCCFYDSNTQKADFSKADTTRRYLSAVLKSRKIDLVAMMRDETLWTPEKINRAWQARQDRIKVTQRPNVPPGVLLSRPKRILSAEDPAQQHSEHIET